MANPFRAIKQWLKYDRLHYYRALDHLDRETALQRLKSFERRVRGPELRLVKLGSWAILCAGFFVLFAGILPLQHALLVIGLGTFASVSCDLYRYRRLRGRLDAAAEAERSNHGKIAYCLDCGYDLRGSEGDLCPECGQAIRVTSPNVPSQP